MRLAFEDVSYSYEGGEAKKRRGRRKKDAARQPDAVWALRDVTFTVEPGEFFGVAGHTGSGKSTLIQHMNGLVHPTCGRVLADGRDLAEKGVATEVRRQVGLVFQYPENQLFANTVYDDVAFGPRNMGLGAEEVDRRVREGLALVGLSFDELSERSPFDLSGGQQRRVAFAGVLAMEPEVLVLDEPVAGLDPLSREEFLGLIRELHAGGRTIVMVSHSMEDLAALSDRILVLSEGRVFRLGTPAEVFADAAALKAVGLGAPAPEAFAASLREAGFTLGRDVTTFCDLSAAPTTIDFQGPNAYNFNFATMIRYEYAFADNHLKFGVAAEMPSVSGTYNDNFATLKQRVPDFPAYFQYAWGANRDSHIRASGVVRNMYLHNLRTGNNTSLLGWGVQFSGTIKVAQPLRLFMNGVYGKGVTPYIQDLTGSGLDFTPNPENADQIQTMPMWGWQAAAQINLTPRLFISGGYSTVRVQRSHGFYSDDQYKQGQYIFGNIFYSITPRCKVAGEYLYGSRKDMSNDKGHANRVNVMLQYSF